MSLRARTETQETQTDLQPNDVEVVDISEDMLERRLSAMNKESRGSSEKKSRRKDRSNLRVEIKRTSSAKRERDYSNEPKTVYLRETEDLKGKGRFCVNIGI